MIVIRNKAVQLNETNEKLVIYLNCRISLLENIYNYKNVCLVDSDIMFRKERYNKFGVAKWYGNRGY